MTKTLKEEIDTITEEYGQLHQDCDLNEEDGSYDGCTCSMRFLVKEVVSRVVEHLSYDITFIDDKQRKAAVRLYLEDFKL